MNLPVTAAASVAFIYHSIIHRKERNGGRDKATTVSKAVNCSSLFTDSSRSA
jgi:hypothetical protein